MPESLTPGIKSRGRTGSTSKSFTPGAEYHFSCQLCGDCCCGDIDIFLNLFDLYKLAKYLGYPESSLLFSRKYIRFTRSQNGCLLPRLHFKIRPVVCCPFLENRFTSDEVLQGLCRLHPRVKPLVCGLAPLGRQVDYRTGEERCLLTPPTADCPGMRSEAVRQTAADLRTYTRELAYEYRYFRLMDRLAESGLAGEEPHALYYFSLERNFEEILSGWERQILGTTEPRSPAGTA